MLLHGVAHAQSDRVSPRRGDTRVLGGITFVAIPGGEFKYDKDYYQHTPLVNPTGPPTDATRPQRRADRGGGWCFDVERVRVSARHAGPGAWDEGGTADCLGFRPVMEVPASDR